MENQAGPPQRAGSGRRVEVGLRHLTQEMGVQGALDDVASSIRQALPGEQAAEGRVQVGQRAAQPALPVLQPVPRAPGSC